MLGEARGSSSTAATLCHVSGTSPTKGVEGTSQATVASHLPRLQISSNLPSWWPFGLS